MLRVRLLGGLALERDGAELILPAARSARLLAGWLALHPGMHARAALAPKLRPDVLDESARQSLRQAAWSLRGVVGADLVATRDAVGFGPDVEVDVRTFDAAAAAGDVDGALALCHGELLAGLEEEWVLVARDAHARALDELLALAAEEAPPARALVLHRRRADLDPLSEDAHRALMRSLAAHGDVASALAVFDRLRDRLARELGTAPSAATRELNAQLRAPASSAGLPASSSQAAQRLRTRSIAPLVGRDADLDALTAAWEDARSGARRVALVAGEPGIGKTRLAAELVDRVLAAGGAALAGCCPQEGAVPYAPFAEVLGSLAGAAGQAVLADAVGPQASELARLVPALRDLPTPTADDVEGARHRLYAAVDAALTASARNGGLLLVIDDLHWADEPTLGMLAHLATARDPARLLMVATLRATATRAAPALGSLLARLRRDPAVLDLRLEALEPGAAWRLAGAAGDEEHAAAITRRAGGNPLLLEELARAGVGPGDVPVTVRELVAERVEHLGAGVADTVAVAAVQGAEFDLATVEALAGGDPLPALEAALADGLVVETPGRPGGFAFRHALVHEAVLSSLSASRRARLHGAVARALTGRAGPSQLAHHWRAAIDVLPDARDRAIAASRAAAGEALAALAFEEAARHFASALADLGDGDDELRLGLLGALGAAHGRAGAGGAARLAYGEALILARRLADSTALAEAALGIGGVGVAILRVDTDFVALLEEALAAQPRDERRLRARLLGRLGVELYYAGEPGRRRGEACSDEAVALARGTGDPEALGAALHSRRIALWRADRLEERLATTAEMVALGERESLLELEVQGRHWRVVDLMETGDMDAADAELDRYAAATDRLGIPAWSWYVPLWRGCRATMTGDYERALALAAEAARLGERAGDPNAQRSAWILESAILLEQERFAELDLPEALASLAASAVPGAWHSGIAWALAARGEHDMAREHLDAVAREDWAILPRDANQLSCTYELAEATAHLGDAARGRELLAMLEPYAGRNIINARAVSACGSSWYALGRAATAAGDLDAAEAHMRRAAEHNRAMGALPRAALAERRIAELQSSRSASSPA